VLHIFYASTSVMWVVLALLSLVFAWRRSFQGKAWLITFISINLFAFIIGFFLPLLLGSSEATNQILRTYFTNVSPVIYIGSLAFLLMFLLNLQTSKSQANSPFSPNVNSPYTSDANKPTSTSLLPPLWLLILTGMTSVMCLIHNIDGSILRSIVVSITKPTSGFGAARDFASQLNAMNTLANVVGTLYIITLLLWLACIAIVIFKYFIYRKQISA